jgi:hypothetical protein
MIAVRQAELFRGITALDDSQTIRSTNRQDTRSALPSRTPLAALREAIRGRVLDLCYAADGGGRHLCRAAPAD